MSARVFAGLRAVGGVLGVLQLGLGLAFWGGVGLQFVGLHMWNGVLLVLLLWAAALLAWRPAGAARGALALGWGVLTLGLGVAQDSLLPGDAHWTVQVLHLIVGLALLAQLQLLARAGMAAARAAPARATRAA